MNGDKRPWLMLGAGGHASVVLEALQQQRKSVLALVSPDCNLPEEQRQGMERHLNDEAVEAYSASEVVLANGVGSVPGSQLRRSLFKRFCQYTFPAIIAQSAMVSRFASLEEGVQVMPGAIVNAGVKLGFGTIVNSGAIVEHGCQVGAHCHIAPGATLSGDVTLGEGVHIGTGASITEGVTIGNGSVVAAGAMVNRRVPAGSILYAARPHLVQGEDT